MNKYLQHKGRFIIPTTLATIALAVGGITISKNHNSEFQNTKPKKSIEYTINTVESSNFNKYITQPSNGTLSISTYFNIDNKDIENVLNIITNSRKEKYANNHPNSQVNLGQEKILNTGDLFYVNKKDGTIYLEDINGNTVQYNMVTKEGHLIKNLPSSLEDTINLTLTTKGNSPSSSIRKEKLNNQVQTSSRNNSKNNSQNTSYENKNIEMPTESEEYINDIIFNYNAAATCKVNKGDSFEVISEKLGNYVTATDMERMINGVQSGLQTNDIFVYNDKLETLYQIRGDKFVPYHIMKNPNLNL